MSTTALAFLLLLTFTVLTAWAADPPARPARPDGTLKTRWATNVSPTAPWPEYPRPQLVRQDWLNLNGSWDYAIRPRAEAKPTGWDGKILVPFPVESQLSGVQRWVTPEQRLWYRRTFNVPSDWKGKRLLLHFGAVDWEATVLVNGKDIGAHRGGYDGFTFDITDALKPDGEQELVVAVWDPSDGGPQPRGKQVSRPHGIWYTPTTGIWQTPWLEPVSGFHVESLKITPDVDAGAVRIEARFSAVTNLLLAKFEVLDQNLVVTQQVSVAVNSRDLSFRIFVPEPRLWSPESPYLYGLRLTLLCGLQKFDGLESYFGMRKIAMAKDENGTLRLFLNNKPYFQFGPLDQGFWPDGLYTAPTDEALRYDIEMTKKLGFNMARKHVKVEPERWYYWCDKLGLLVWQDMPSGDKSARWRGPSGYDGEEMQRTPESRAIYETELKAIMDARYNHPCIVVWVPFNEGWGQFDTVRLLNWTMTYDPSRLVDGASGGNHFPAGHILDHHQYPGPGAPKPVADRALVLGEFGGLGLPMSGHTWQDERNWGYRSFTNAESLTTAYLALIRKLHPMIRDSKLAAAIYTQTTDVEIEINGLMTYDRAKVKMDEQSIAAANNKLYLPPPVRKPLAPDARHKPVPWLYTTSQPADTWMQPKFDDSVWTSGPSGFGEPTTPNSVVNTNWKTPDIWLRRKFTLERVPRQAILSLFHDEDATVFLNGTRILSVTGYTTDYEEFPLDAAALAALRRGDNTLAIWCHQTRGGQFIDAGLLEELEAPAK